MKPRDGIISFDEENCQQEVRVTRPAKLPRFIRQCIGQDCKRKFKTKSRYSRLCKKCKNTDTYRFSDVYG